MEADSRQIHYAIEKNLSASEFIDILERSTLGERRPVNDPSRIATMLAKADIVVTARHNGILVGVSRALSDFSFCTYLSDLAVASDFQSRGIGKELIRRTKEQAPLAKLILLSAPKAVNYYPKIGMSRHEHCYFIDRTEEIV